MFFLTYAVAILFLYPRANDVMATKSKKSVPWPPVVQTDRGLFHKSIYNGTDNLWYYRFNSIKYGRVVNRFAAPVPICSRSYKSCHRANPLVSKAKPSADPIMDDLKCPQATPRWAVPSTSSRAKRDIGIRSELIQVPENEVEDCLFLDVVVPKKVWEQSEAHPERGHAPVLIWIHNGGFTAGDKSLQKDPSLLLRRGLQLHEGGMVIVSISYRLGLFGFLSGSKGLESNVGLLDQRMALGWVQNHIEKFGGDRFRVTVVGEGAGAGSIMHHLTAPNISQHFFPDLQSPHHHHRRFPFRSAILQSPTFQPLTSSQSKANLDYVLTETSRIAGYKVDHIDQLHKLPFEVLYAVNTAIVDNSPYGTYTFGPVVNYAEDDKSYVPDFPLRRLHLGIMAKDVNLLVGQRRNEGQFLTPSTMATDTGFKAHLSRIFSTAAARDIDYISESVYPSSDYETIDDGGMNRSIEAIGDIFTGCNVYYLLNTSQKSFGYLLEVNERSREQLLENVLVSGSPVVSSISTIKHLYEGFQDKLIKFGMFALVGVKLTALKQYRDHGEVLLVSDKGFDSYINDPTAKHQCQYWAEAPYENIFSD
ncbi:Carboxylesterase patB [Golovinomyces cichoracearum]|uniref:Carboxylesterase patB n=1 Tax=Golovinomyces cichoracearum TaxID=62708 RepID=A0A420J339_9PEZI|nr:Carboxylesterase patB [Golovinomyces cichoracearum]